MAPPLRDAMSLAQNTTTDAAAENRQSIAISSRPAASYFIRNYRCSLPALFALILLAVGLLIYSPILPGAFVMDDLKLVQWDNPIVNGTAGPAHIWFRADFPLSTLVFWLQWKAWGSDPLGYHLINISLHALSSFVLWLVLMRLRIRGAGLAALLYMAHPVCVGTVARIAELKNTLSMPFFLLSLWGYLGYERKRLFSENSTDHRDASGLFNSATGYYLLSLVSFVLALLAKAAVIMLPVVLLGCAFWQRGRVRAKDIIHTTPHFALALGFGLMSTWFQKCQALGGDSLGHHSLWSRIGTAAHVVCFYAQKSLWPVYLNVIYPRWDAAVGMDWGALVCVLGIGVTAAVGWFLRRGVGRHLLFGLFAYMAILFPAMGFLDAQFMRNWQVSDHLQYAAIIVPIAGIATMIASVAWQRVSMIALPALVGGLALISHERCRLFTGEEVLLRDAVSKNPTAWAAHNDLGCLAAQQQKLAEAIRHFELSLRHNPDFPDAHINLGQALLCTQRPAEAEAHFATVLRQNPAHADAHRGAARILISRNRHHEALLHYRAALHTKPDAQTFVDLASILHQQGDCSGAISELQRAVALNPDHIEALNNLAWLRATAADGRSRDGEEAVKCARRACLLAQMKDARALGTLAAAYAEAGSFEPALRTANKAISISESSGNPQFAAVLRQLAGLYRQRISYHEPSRKAVD